MQTESILNFGPYKLDRVNMRLWRGTQVVLLRPKPFAILLYLVEHPGRLVSKAEILQAIWPDTTVSEGVLKSYIHDLRTVLGDNVETPQFVETVARRGYRFIRAVRATAEEAPYTERQKASKSILELLPTQRLQTASPPLMVGREAELRRLQGWLGRALEGHRQVAFVTGEAGIGKTTVVEAFLACAVLPQGCWIGYGQSIEHFGVGEAYLPVLAALGQLCREPGQPRFRALLGQHAPSWLLQMPALLGAAERETLQQQTLGVTRERMLRELTEALEALTAQRPLILVLEDLQWSDHATLDLLAFLARRRQPARLLVIGTYRPVEVILQAHPLGKVKQELQLHGQCAELPLELLPEPAVAEYLGRRFPARRVPAAVARMIYQRTDGNPLFMVTVVEDLVVKGLLVSAREELALQREEQVARGVPESVRQMIEQQCERLPAEDQQLLEVASVFGMEFSAAAVAAGVAAAVDEVEEQCVRLARGGPFLQANGLEEWPDGTVAARCKFPHALYQEVMYERVPAGRRTHLHQRIGERKEAAYGARAEEIAAELAVHFEQGRDTQRAVQYLRHAGGNALRRNAYQEAINHLIKGLELLKLLPDTPERAQQELLLQMTLGLALMSTRGFAAPEVERAYARAREVSQQLGDTPQLFPVLFGLRIFYITRAEFHTALALAEQLLRIAQAVQDPALLLIAYTSLGTTLFALGEVTAAHTHFAREATLYDPQQQHSYISLYGQDPGVICRCYTAWTLWDFGFPDQALQKIQEADALAQELSHPFTQAGALFATAMTHQLRREGQLTQEWTEAAITLATEQGFPLWWAITTILRGWALTEQGQGEEGIVQMRQGLAAYRATGAEVNQPYCLALLAEALGKVGQEEEGLSKLAEALTVVHRNGERYYEAELYRLKGTLTLQSKVSSPKSQVEEAEECFHKAIEIAHRQSAKSLELRAVMSLVRLWQQQGKRDEARQLLAEIYGWFTEGFDTADLHEAQALLAELS